MCRARGMWSLWPSSWVRLSAEKFGGGVTSAGANVGAACAGGSGNVPCMSRSRPSVVVCGRDAPSGTVNIGAMCGGGGGIAACLPLLFRLLSTRYAADGIVVAGGGKVWGTGLCELLLGTPNRE